MKLKVISLFAGPGAGKSTTAAAVFARMKRLRFNVELVTEHAKDLTYEKAFARLANQLHVLSEQNFKIARLAGQTEYVITDSPLPLSLIYCKPEDQCWIEPLVSRLWSDYDNYPFILKRSAAPYVRHGRNQNEDEARALDARIHELAREYGARIVIDPDINGIEDTILREVNAARMPVA